MIYTIEDVDNFKDLGVFVANISTKKEAQDVVEFVNYHLETGYWAGLPQLDLLRNFRYQAEQFMKGGESND